MNIEHALALECLTPLCTVFYFFCTFFAFLVELAVELEAWTLSMHSHPCTVRVWS